MSDGQQQKKTGWTPEKRAKFLAELAQTGNATLSAKLIGLSRARAYALRKEDAEFSAAWDDAISESSDHLESEARRRAVTGVQKPVYQGGKLVGHVQEYSDTLLIFLLKGNNPEKFADRSRLEHTGKDGGPIETAHSFKDVPTDKLIDILKGGDE